MAITATVRRRVDEDWVAVSLPTYGFPHSIRDHTKVKRGQEIELTGEVTRIDGEDGKVTLNLRGALVTVDRTAVRLLEKYRPPTRRRPLVDTSD